MKDSALHQNLLIKFYFPTYLSTTPTIKVYITVTGIINLHYIGFIYIYIYIIFK